MVTLILCLISEATKDALLITSHVAVVVRLVIAV